jgi:hypothetical protein
MTLVSSIITDAYRETNLVSMTGGPSAAHTTEALSRLNSIIVSTMGFEAGDDLQDLNYGGDYDQSSVINEWVPDNLRLILNLTAATTLQLDPMPYEGQRLAIVDAGSNLNTYNLILDGNGRTIEGAASVTLSTDDTVRQWMYRGDTGNWVPIETLASGDDMPFPEEFDDFFITMLAMRLNPRYGQQLAQESIERLKSTRGRIRARYRRKTFDVLTDPGLVKRDCYGFDGSENSFNRGGFWSWLT